ASGLTIKDIETKFSRPEFIPAKANLTKIYGEAGDYVVCRYDMPGREKAHFIVVYDKTNGQAPEWFAKGRDYPLEYKGSTVVRLHKAQHLIAVYNTERTSWDDNAGLYEHYLLLDTKAGRVVVDSGAARSYNGPESYKTVVGRDYCVLLERGVNYNTHYVDKKQQAHEAYVELNIHSLTGRRAIHSLNSYWFSREHLSNLQDIKIIGGHYLLMEYLPSAESCYIELYDIRELLKTDSLPRPFYASSCAGYVYEPQTNKFSVDGQTIDLTAPDSRDEMTGEGDTSKNALRRDLGLNGEAPVAQAVSITPAYALPKQKSSLGMADDSWTIEQIQRSRSFEAVKRDGHVPLRKGYHILTDAFRRGQHYYNRYEITQTSKGGYIGLEPVSRDGSRRIGSEFFTSRGTLDAAITFVKRTRSVAPQQNNTVGRPREAGKSPLDLLTLIRRNIKPGDVISAPILYDFYLAQYKKLRFEAPAKRDSALRTIERDLFGAINSLLAMRFIRELPGKGPNGERQFVEVTYDTRAARTNVAQVGTPVKSILEVIDEYGAPISRENGPGVLMPSPTEIASFYPAISMLESERVEVYLPKNISDSLTRSVTEEIRRINIVIRERIREHTARTDNIDDPIKVVPYNSSNLESCLGRKGDGVRRIFVNDISMTADFRRLTDSEGGLDLLRGARIFTAAVPAGRGETEKTVNQAWLIKVAILVSLLDESNIVTIGATLRAELEGRGIDDPVKFVLNLSKVEDSSISRERVRDRINYFLGNIVVLSTFIGEQLRILKAFWIAA
ncbi:MAG: hypothetical protein NTZ95_06795, partial [Candidatus Omnitrophica bacterium]|nr:hypothetical protein [Candidatus Omnitrophota bacterium]